MPARVPPALAETLAEVAARMGGARDPWWIVGSAAVVLRGAATEVADVDLLVSEADARALLSAGGVKSRPGARSARFRSAVFGTLEGAPLPIEVMGGLALNEDGVWAPLRLETRERHCLGPSVLWVPARAELIALLRRFGREKDVARAALLEALA